MKLETQPIDVTATLETKFHWQKMKNVNASKCRTYQLTLKSCEEPERVVFPPGISNIQNRLVPQPIKRIGDDFVLHQGSQNTADSITISPKASKMRLIII